LKYNIIKALNSGAFGIVYEIRGEDNKIYALKELKNFDVIHKQRFQREITILAQLNHPNIVRIFRWNIGGEPPNFSPYYIMVVVLSGNIWMKDSIVIENMFLREDGLSAESFYLYVMH
jgi:serine/threonine protein kinase